LTIGISGALTRALYENGRLSTTSLGSIAGWVTGCMFCSATAFENVSSTSRCATSEVGPK
jgi:hypothetical protein